jgi:hypothetical protein
MYPGRPLIASGGSEGEMMARMLRWLLLSSAMARSLGDGASSKPFERRVSMTHRELQQGQGYNPLSVFSGPLARPNEPNDQTYVTDVTGLNLPYSIPADGPAPMTLLHQACGIIWPDYTLATKPAAFTKLLITIDLVGPDLDPLARCGGQTLRWRHGNVRQADPAAACTITDQWFRAFFAVNGTFLSVANSSIYSTLRAANLTTNLGGNTDNDLLVCGAYTGDFDWGCPQVTTSLGKPAACVRWCGLEALSLVPWQRRSRAPGTTRRDGSARITASSRSGPASSASISSSS